MISFSSLCIFVSEKKMLMIDFPRSSWCPVSICFSRLLKATHSPSSELEANSVVCSCVKSRDKKVHLVALNTRWGLLTESVFSFPSSMPRLHPLSFSLFPLSVGQSPLGEKVPVAGCVGLSCGAGETPSGDVLHLCLKTEILADGWLERRTELLLFMCGLWFHSLAFSKMPTSLDCCHRIVF